jgi:hypothetical protein
VLRWTAAAGALFVGIPLILTLVSGWGVARSEYWGQLGSALLSAAFVIGVGALLVVVPVVLVARRLRFENERRIGRGL